MAWDAALEQTIQTSGTLRCLECGKCTAICPVARFDGGFSPRVTVSRALARRGHEEELYCDDRLWSCLNCLQCSETCPANVDYAALTTAVRAEARRYGRAALCTHGEAIHVWMRMMTQPDLKQDRLGWLKPVNSEQSTVNSEQLMVNSQQPTVNSQQSTVNSQQPTVNSQQSTVNSEQPTVNSELFTAHCRRPLERSRRGSLLTSSTSDTLYFAGCAPHYDALFAPLGVAGTPIAQSSVRVLNALGIEPQVLANERCCGHDLLWEGDLDRFLQLARLNAEMIRAAGVKRIVSSCPECVRALKIDYPAHGIRLNAEVLHLSELLAASNFEFKIQNSKPKTGNRHSKIVTFHDPCRLGRHLGIYDAPRQVLAKLGYQVVEMRHNRRNATCCGTNGWTHCDAANKAIQAQRLREAKATGAEVLVTACLKCQIHFKCALMDAALRDEVGIEMIDWAELVATGIQG